MHRFVTRTIDRPAPGVDWSFVPSSSDSARLLSIVGPLTTDDAGTTRQVTVTVTDETGNVITTDVSTATQEGGNTYTYSWRGGWLSCQAIATALVTTSSIPGFWLPPGATVAADTTNLNTAGDSTAASYTSNDETGLLPVTIVTGVNDTFTWTGDGGGGAPEQFVIAAGVYTTTVAMAAAMEAAIGEHAEAFSTIATVASLAGMGYLITAVADAGANGNGDAITAGTTHDATVSIFTESPPLTLSGGEGPYPGDQWGPLVATFVVADIRSLWIAEDTLIDLYQTVT